MKKLKDLLKESFVWERQFGEALPTLASVQQKKNEGNLTEASAKVTVGFSNEMGALYLSARGDTGGNKSIELRKADVEAIIKQYKKFKSKMD